MNDTHATLSQALAENSTSRQRSRLALLGIQGHLHAQPPRYSVVRLRALVETLEPDLLGVEMPLGSWERGDLGEVPVQVREALVPAARCTDTVIVPLGGPVPGELASPKGGKLARLRASLMRRADCLLTGLQDTTDGPSFSHVCRAILSLEAMLASNAGREAWRSTNQRILEWLLWAVRRDRGRRVLAAVQCRRVHWLELRLKRRADLLELVDYRKL